MKAGNPIGVVHSFDLLECIGLLQLLRVGSLTMLIHVATRVEGLVAKRAAVQRIASNVSRRHVFP